MTGKMGPGVLATGVLLVGALALVMLHGCGGERATGAGQPTHGESQAGEDVLLFGGEESPAGSPAEGEFKAPLDHLKGTKLPVNGGYYWFDVDTHETIKHRFWTQSGRVYQVTVSVRSGHETDNPALYIGRNSHIDTAHYWLLSIYPTPYPEIFVFRATKDANMYLLVRGQWDGDGDGQVSYAIQVRRAQFATYSR